jgi:hypothetical protein
MMLLVRRMKKIWRHILSSVMKKIVVEYLSRLKTSQLKPHGFADHVRILTNLFL